MNKRCSRRSRRAIALLVFTFAIALLFPPHAQARAHPRVLVLVTSGLSWSDVNPQEKTGREFLEALGPASLANLTRHNAAKTTCPLDGYLTLSTGMRVTATQGRASGHCPDIPDVSSGKVAASFLKSWRQDASRQNEQALPGTLGQSLEESGTKVRAIGEGAAIAAMDSAGKIAKYSPLSDTSRLTSQVKTALADSDVTIVDVGAVSPSAEIKVSPTSLNATPADGLPQVDRTSKPRSEQILKALTAALRGAGEEDLIFGLDVADHSATPHLGMAFLREPGAKTGILRSSSTRQLGLLATVDFTRQILDVSGANGPDYLVGGSFSPERDYGLTGNLDWLRNQSLRADQATIVQARFIVLTGIILLLSTALLLFLLRRKKLRSSSRTRGLLAGICLSASLLGPASTVAAYTPTKMLGGSEGNLTTNALKMSAPLLTTQFLLLVLLIAGVFSALCFAGGKLIARKWTYLRYSAPILAAAALVLAWILVSLLSGSPDQISAMFSSAATAATRFYGLNNNKYSFLFSVLLALECLIFAPLAARFPERRRRYFAYGFLLLAVAVILDGFPWLGADVGGPLAMILGVGITLNWVLGKKVGIGKVVALIMAALLSSSVFVLVDKMASPTSRTHFGRFISEVRGGGGGIIVARKAQAMINSFGGPIGFAVVMTLVLVVITFKVIKNRPGYSAKRRNFLGISARQSLKTIPGAYRFAQGVILTSLLAALTNDSGALILVCSGLFTLPAINAMLILSAGAKEPKPALTPEKIGFKG
ncbi:hypothetical protein [uncultured Varibaculum sp.]|uniref:hypothetical protein n=1 Tax=uncultured Varibaculum sp. TaxID=413896 RepID=UPI002594DD3B|nr:hypothetical protein [uncultured Varibaculum sp.]